MKFFYEFNPRLGADQEEKALANSVQSLSKANPEPLVQFLHITLNNLATLLVRPSVTEESAKVSSYAFGAMANIVHTVQSLYLPHDKHERNVILSSYLQYVFNSPQGQHSAGAFDSKTATLTKGRTSSFGTSEEDYMSVAAKFSSKGGSVRGTKGVSFNSECITTSIRLLACHPRLYFFSPRRFQGISTTPEFCCIGQKGEMDFMFRVAFASYNVSDLP